MIEAISKMDVMSVPELAKWYFRCVEQLVESVDLAVLEGIVNHLRVARNKGASVFIMGNGGSAATASHFANDMGKASKRSGQVAIRVLSLTDNIPWLTALANDEGYGRVFAGQLENYVRPGDVVIVMSASGNSENLVRAVELAKARGALTIGFIGFEGGVLRRVVDESLFVPSGPGAYGPVEDIHMMLQHIITCCLMQA